MQNTDKTTLNQLRFELESDGWRECPNRFKKYARCFYKRFETPTRCHCNDDKPGIQVEIAATEKPDDSYFSFEIELTGELADGTWLTIHNYAVPNNVKEATALVPRLLKTWEAANHS